ncbi:MAG: TM2 domain-containing protein [Ruminococcus sp.]|nr:TM2 domain-containing protein [Ruminococcus sp.]
MYCKNCGNPVDPNAAVCTQCGVPVGQGTNFCANCGQQTPPGSVVCMSCGYSLSGQSRALPGAKSKMAAGLLGIFLGAWGVHNFYLGYTGKGIAQLCLTILGLLTSCIYIGVFLCLGASIWGLIEGIMILSGSINTDAQGNMLAD